MKHSKKLLALLLAAVMCLSVLSGCTKPGDVSTSNPTTSGTNPSNPNPSNPNPSNPTPVDPTAPVAGLSARGSTTVTPVTGDKTLVVACEMGLEGKFSPFFALSAADQDVVDMFTIGSIGVDRVSNPIYNGIQGETRSYNGTDYTYKTASDVVVTQNDDGTVWYDITLRQDIYFSDGKQATIDDLIFAYYVYLDPSYDGNATLYSIPIQGLKEYRSNFAALLLEAGKDNTDYSQWSKEDQDLFWSELETAGAAFAQEIVDYLIKAGANTAEDDLSKVTPNWGFSVPEGATTLDFFYVMLESYENDLKSLSDTETAGSSLTDLMPSWSKWSALPENSAQYISGIVKTGDFSMRVITTEFSANAIYQVGQSIVPLYHYGDESQYDYNAHKFGFPKGDLSGIKAKTQEPLGAGPFVYESYANGVVTMKVNPTYFQGAPQFQYIQFKETSEAQKLTGLTTATLDVADPSYSTRVAKDIAKANGLSEDQWETFDGSVLTTKLIDYRGYGYIGIAANRVMVGDKPYSEESKNLRKAFATLFAAYREETIRSYYGTTASIINYPISNTSWAAPQVTDDGYQVAYSKDVNGGEIYTASMTTDQKYEAAMQAALGYFAAAGYTVTDGKVTAAPAGASLEYTVHIGGGGSGDHPTFLLLKNVSEALQKVGVKLFVQDWAQSSDLYASYQNNEADMWVAAWRAASDPDMFQLYHTNGSTNYYQISDSDLDEAIMMARASADQAYRKALYQGAMEIIMEYAVEVPVYQRSDATVLRTPVVQIDTLPGDMTPYWGWAAEIEQLALK